LDKTADLLPGTLDMLILKAVSLKPCLVSGICGSLIRSNGAGKPGQRTRCRMMRASALLP